MRGTKFVEAHGKLWAQTWLDGGEGGKRNVFSLVVADVELSNVFRPGAIFTLGLDIDLPLAAEAVEVVDKVAAHESLNRPVDVVQVHALLQNLVAVDVDELLRDAGQESGAEAGNLRPLASRFHKSAQVLREELDIAAGTVFQDESESAGGANPRNGGRGKRESDSRRQLA